MGMATSRPRWAADKPKSATIEFARAPISTQTMKLTSKYRKAASKVGQWPAWRKSRRRIEVLSQPHGTGLICRLFGVRVEHGEGQLVDRLVVHGNENLAGGHRGGDESPRLDAAALRFDVDPLARPYAERFRVGRIDFHVDVSWIEL